MRWITLTVTGSVVVSGIVAPARAQEIWFEDRWDDCAMTYAHSPLWVTTAAAVGDYDDDGWYDVLLVGSEVSGTRLFRNQRDGTFADVSLATLPADIPDAQMAVFADLDNDRATDIILCELVALPGESRLRIYRNVHGSFKEMLGLPETYQQYRTAGLAVSDYDRDGDLDIYYTRHPGASQLLRNDGDFRFSDITKDAGPDTLRAVQFSWQPVFADFNDDGWPDLHVAVDFGKDRHFVNNGDGTFTDVSVESGSDHDGHDMGIAVGDIENDGDLDMFATNLQYEHALHVNNDDGTFSQLVDERLDHYGGVGWGTMFVDFDHDTLLDLLYVVQWNLSPPDQDPEYDMNPYDMLLRNTGGGYFVRYSQQAGMDMHEWHWSLVTFDYDRDGDVDVLAMGDGAQGDAPRLMENISLPSTGHWLAVELRGDRSNSEGIGARLEFETGSTTQIREVLGGASFYAGLPYTVHVGLGDATSVDRLTIRWPSGAIQVLQDVSADQYVRIHEFSTTTRANAE